MNPQPPAREDGVEVRRPTSLSFKLTIFGIGIPAVAWVSFVYERLTGLTLVLDRHKTTALGFNSGAEHLHQTLNLAIGATFIGAGLLLCAKLLQDQR